ncbi:TPA: hypothetical protein PCF55_005528 [Klebsiella pneumoniae]|nr:hypothetical protein [Klebsiella pneumoniae]
MQDPSLRTYRIAFLGSNASGNLPMFTRVQATTGKRAIKGEHEKPRGSHRMMPSTGVKITTIIS